MADPGRQHAYQSRQPSTAPRPTGPEVVPAFPPADGVCMRLASPSLPSLEVCLGVLHSRHQSLAAASGWGHDPYLASHGEGVVVAVIAAQEPILEGPVIDARYRDFAAAGREGVH